MATKEQKFKALNVAIEITKESCRGENIKAKPSQILEDSYNKIIEITDAIDLSEN